MICKDLHSTSLKGLEICEDQYPTNSWRNMKNGDLICCTFVCTPETLTIIHYSQRCDSTSFFFFFFWWVVASTLVLRMYPEAFDFLNPLSTNMQTYMRTNLNPKPSTIFFFFFWGLKLTLLFKRWIQDMIWRWWGKQ